MSSEEFQNWGQAVAVVAYVIATTIKAILDLWAKEKQVHHEQQIEQRSGKQSGFPVDNHVLGERGRASQPPGTAATDPDATI